LATTLTRERLPASGEAARLGPGPVLIGCEGSSLRPEALARELDGARFDIVYTGPQRRIREAATALAMRLGLRPVVHEALQELPGGPAALAGLLRTARFAQEVRLRPRVLVIAPGGTLRVLLLLLGGWRRLPWLWRPVPKSEPLICACEGAALSLRGPFFLLLAGLALGLIAVPGPWPGWTTFASLLVALLAYRWAARTAAGGHAGRIAGLLVALALAGVPLAFGPDPVDHRKVTSFNAWAYRLGAHLPQIILPAPNPNAVAGLLAVALALTAAVALYGQGRRRHLASAATILTAGALILTASRTGWCAGVAALLIVAAGRGRRVATIALGLSGLIVTAFLSTSPALGSTIDLAIRQSLWQATIAMVRSHAFTGIGLGRVAQAGIIVSGAFGQARLEATHNMLLQLWADAGVLGLLACAWTLLLLARSVLAPVEGRAMPTWAIAGLYGALLAFLVQGLFETNTIFIWSTGGARHQLVSPLPFILLGLLSGLEQAEVHAARAAAQAASRPLRPMAPRLAPGQVTWLKQDAPPHHISSSSR